MLGLADYGSSDDEDTKPTKTQTTTTTINNNNNNNNKDTNQSKKRVINVSLPLAFGSKDEEDEDDDEDTRPAKKANTGFSLSNLLPAPKNTPSADREKKQNNKQNNTPAPQTKITTASTTVAGPTRNIQQRTANPLLHLHKKPNNTKKEEDKEEEIDSDDFFPIAAAAAQPVRPTPAPLPPPEQPKPQIQQQKQQQQQQQQPQQQYQYTEQEQQAYDEQQAAAYYAQQQYYEQQQYYQQQQQQQQYQQQTTAGSYTEEFLNDPTMQQGIHNPYQGRSKREVMMDSLGANIKEVSQKDILKTDRPVFSDQARLAELRKAKMSISAPKPTKLQRSRHQLTAMVYEAKQKEIESQERNILYGGRY